MMRIAQHCLLVGFVLLLDLQGSVRAFAPPVQRTNIVLPSLSSTSLRNKQQQPLYATNKEDDSAKDKGKKKKRKPYYGKRQRKSSKGSSKSKPALTKDDKKEIISQAAKELRGDTENDGGEDDDGNLLGIVNPFRAGKKLRQTLESLTVGIPEATKSIYLDDRVGMSLAERNPTLQRQSDYVPEVLVIGATGDVGRLVVQRLLLQGNVRVRVLVRDLYSKTLNLLGTGVTYCQGELANYESLEYAVTDVDKIVFCAGAPRPDEDDFQKKFKEFMRETLTSDDDESDGEATTNDLEWEEMDSILQLRAELAEQVDCIGMQNVVRAYQNVRFADYGASQTAKRSLFKFGSKNEDFNLFAIEEEDEEGMYEDFDDDDDDNYDYEYDQDDEDALDEEESYYDTATDQYDLTDGEEYTSAVQLRQGGVLTKTQCLWMRNKFNHAVFVGKVLDLLPGGQAAVLSSRLRSRDDPENGIDLSNGFGGFIVRICSDGGTYEAFVRTELYETDGIEYVCEFTTETKVQQSGSNKSRNKFTTVRLGFENFKPVKRDSTAATEEVPQFRGRDMRLLGFRYRADANEKKLRKNRFFVKNKQDVDKYSQFYLAFDYIKVYRSQPEPEFVYLSDARVPPKVSSGMVRHDRKQLREMRDDGEEEDDDSTVLLKEGDVVDAALLKRSSEETYFKYRGEEILKNSGLSYAIVRVSGFNEVSSGESSTIELSASHSDEAVSRADVADVCTGALVDPNALNKSFYVTKSTKAATMQDENMSAKFSALPVDA